MEELLNSLSSAQKESPSPTDVSRYLFKFQNEMNAQYFSKLFYNPKDKQITIEAIFTEIWKFLLYAASHPSSTVRLAAYRLTGSFLLKLQPYYTTQIQTTFSSVSTNATIDIKRSAIVASSFAFLSKRISLPYLDEFLDSTPVFHHFTISDKIFSEHLSSIISNLGELGDEWFSTLLNSFLLMIHKSNDRYLMRSISVIIKRNPVHFFDEVLQYIYSQNNYKEFLPLLPFIISSNEVLQTENFNLYPIAKTSLEVLEHQETSNSTEIDSAMQILSLKSESFQIEIKSDDSLKLILVAKDKDPIEINLDISKLQSRPTFYHFALPMELSTPQEGDSLLTIAAKMKSLGKRINTNPEKSQEIWDLFMKYYHDESNENTSSVLQGIAESMQTLIKNIDHKTLIPFLEKVIFTRSDNWFHSSDQLLLIKSIGSESFNLLFGPNGLMRIVDLLVGLCLLQNEQVSKRSSKALKKLITSRNFKEITLWIANRIDLYDQYSLTHLLPLLTSLVTAMNGDSLSHLHFFVHQILELHDLYVNDLGVLTEIFTFLGCFSIDFISIKQIQHSFSNARAIIAASITCISGYQNWPGEINNDLFSAAIEMVDADIRSRNIDVSSEEPLSYEDYLSPCMAAMKFIYALSSKLVNKAFLLVFYEKLRNIFPLMSAKFAEKYWDQLSRDEQVDVIIQMESSLRYVQMYDLAALTCKLFIKIYRIENEQKLSSCKTNLINLATFVKKNPRCTTEEQRLIFEAFLYFTTANRGDPTEEFEKKIQANLPDLYTILFNKLREQPTQPEKRRKSVHVTPVRFDPLPDLTSSIDVSNPIFKTQINLLLKTYSAEELKEYLKYFVDNKDDQGIDLIIRYCFLKKIDIDLSEFTFSQKSLLIVIRYLKSMKSPYLDIILKPLLSKNNLPFALQRTVISITMNNYLEQLKTDEKIQKQRLRIFSQIIPYINFPADDLIQACLHCFTISKSVKKFHYSIRIALNLLNRIEFNENFCSKLLSLFEERYNDLNFISAAFCIQQIVQKTKQFNSRLNLLITKMIASVSQSSPEICNLYLSLVEATKGNPVFLQNLPKVIENLLSLNLPSSFIGGTQLFKSTLPLLTDKSHDYLIKHCFPLLFQQSVKSNTQFNIAEKTAPIILTVYNMGLKRQQQTIFSSYQTLIPNPKYATFLYFTDLLTYFIQYSQSSTKMANDHQMLLNITNQMLTTPGNETLLHLYVQNLSNRADRTLMNKEVDDFLQIYIKKCDLYQMGRVIMYWCHLLYVKSGFKQLLPFVTIHVFRFSPRFSAAFIGVAYFMQDFRKSSNDESLISKMNDQFLGSARLIMKTCRAHAVAVALFTIPEAIKTAIDLALFENDCEDSEKLIGEVFTTYPDLQNSFQ